MDSDAPAGANSPRDQGAESTSATGPGATPGPSSSDDSRIGKIFLGGLSWETTEGEPRAGRRAPRRAAGGGG